MAGVQFSFQPSPDWRRLAKCLRRQGEPDRVPFFELFVNQPVMEAVLGRKFPLDSATAENARLRARGLADFYLRTGYDFVATGSTYGFPRKKNLATANTGLGGGERSFVNTAVTTIPDRSAFEAYDWPEVRDEHFAPVEQAQAILPEGMKVKPLGPGGVLENVMWLMGYEPLSYALADDQRLVQEIFDAVGSRLVALFRRFAAFEQTEFINLGDDMGFKTQTMLPPELLRKYVFPWQKRIVEVIHERGKIAVIHTCGNLREVMEDLIACGWEAKHSFEDVIMPVGEVKRRWGSRIALCGGLDVDKLCRLPVEGVRGYTRELIRECAPGGGWCLGSGNSIADYVPVDKYAAMLEAGRAFGKYPIA
jgi:uroporphyrinogen decarboxylase